MEDSMKHGSAIGNYFLWNGKTLKATLKDVGSFNSKYIQKLFDKFVHLA